MFSRYASPLRYPGGKARLFNFVRLLIHQNKLLDGEYVEPYAGGASLALMLLFEEYVSRIHINDVDVAIYGFWNSVLFDCDVLCDKIQNARLDVDEWKRQRDIYRNPGSGLLERGFAAFYLNRTNRSGIIKSGGVIGGLEQRGKWKLDARFNKDALIKRVRRIARYRNRIQLTNLDAVELLNQLNLSPKNALVYLDPPYYIKGSDLYANSYKKKDHGLVAKTVTALDVPWIVSYDNVPEIKSLYKGARSIEYSLRYTAEKRYLGSEILFLSENMKCPDWIKNPTQIQESTLNSRQMKLI